MQCSYGQKMRVDCYWNESVKNPKGRTTRKAYLIKLVRACKDIPSWSSTFIRWDMKSRKDIAKPFRGAINSLGSTMAGSGLVRRRDVNASELHSPDKLTSLRSIKTLQPFRSQSVRGHHLDVLARNICVYSLLHSRLVARSRRVTKGGSLSRLHRSIVEQGRGY